MLFTMCKIHMSERVAFTYEKSVYTLRPIYNLPRSFFEILKSGKELLIIERLEAIKLQLYVLIQVPLKVLK